VDPRVGLDDFEKRKFFTLPGLGTPNLGRPARSQSLYRLRYPFSCRWEDNIKIDRKEIVWSGVDWILSG
jgi:hypothetical protein